MLARVRSWGERLQGSLFWVPSLYVVGMAALAQGLVEVDARITEGELEPPVAFTSTVEATRVLLSTIAGATIAFAGVAFSIALLTLQLASSQFTPRLVQQMYRDRVVKHIIGFVLGTFAFCLVVLRAVRGSTEAGGEAIIPNLSVALGVVLGLLSLLAVVGFINRAAHKMDVNELLSELTRRALAVVDERCRPRDATDRDAPGPLASALAVPDGEGWAVRSSETGWVQVVDPGALLRALPAQSTAVLWTSAGRFVGVGELVATVWPGGATDRSELESHIRSAVVVGDSRTFDNDHTYGLRQLVDVALKALSPGINDPTTAHEAIHRAGTVLLALLERDLPATEHVGEDRRRLVLAAQPTHEDIVGLAYDQVRVEARDDPTVSGYLLDSMAVQVEALEGAGLTTRADLLRHQARLVGDGAESSDLHPEDLDRVRSGVQRVMDGARAPQAGPWRSA